MTTLRTKEGSLPSEERGTIMEITKNPKNTITAVRGIVTYVGTAGKHATEDSVRAFANADTVLEPCHRNLTAGEGDSATTTL